MQQVTGGKPIGSLDSDLQTKALDTAKTAMLKLGDDLRAAARDAADYSFAVALTDLATDWDRLFEALTVEQLQDPRFFDAVLTDRELDAAFTAVSRFCPQPNQSTPQT